jgi:DNA (cytosine-5)-methyltransferase 1
VPQLRERIIFIGARADVPTIEHIPPSGCRKITVQNALSDLAFLGPWEETHEYDRNYPPVTPYQTESRFGRLFGKYGIRQGSLGLTNHDAARHTPEVIARFALIPPGRGADAIPRPLWDAHLRTAKKWCIRLRADRPSNTITTLPDDLIHYSQHRILTVRECARVQSFDDTFTFFGPRSSGGGGRGNKKRNAELPQYSQVGNAVPPLLAAGIGEALLSALDSLQKFSPRAPSANDLLQQVYRAI